jgi:hypothetical protein
MPSTIKLKQYLNIMKGDIMVYYAKEQKFKSFDNASFFEYGNIHQHDSFFGEWGVQNPSFGKKRSRLCSHWNYRPCSKQNTHKAAILF